MINKLLYIIGILFIVTCDSPIEVEEEIKIPIDLELAISEKECLNNGGWEFFNGICNQNVIDELAEISSDYNYICNENIPQLYDPFIELDGIITIISVNGETYYPELFEHEPFIDLNGNGIYDIYTDIFDPNLHDLNQNGIWDDFRATGMYNSIGQIELGSRLRVKGNNLTTTDVYPGFTIEGDFYKISPNEEFLGNATNEFSYFIQEGQLFNWYLDYNLDETCDEFLYDENINFTAFDLKLYYNSSPNTSMIDFANQHWSFERYVKKYYTYYNYRNEFLNTFEMYKLFSNVPNGIPTMFGNYQSNFEQIVEWNDYNNNSIQDYGEILEWNFTHINDGSHFISFYDPRFDEIKTFPDDPPSNSSNGYFYCLEFNASNSKCNEFGLDTEFEAVLDEIQVQKTLEFYEIIGKYNQFFMGWDDAVLAHEELILSDNISNIGLDVSHFVVTADSMTGPLNGITYDMTDKFNYNSETGEIELIETLNPDFQNLYIYYTKGSFINSNDYLRGNSPNLSTYRQITGF